ncbi:MAG TPA: GxxExxY protein [Vicinamibacterales bacterium]|nr:GxxExxY protein [Vicinamibacterales bacterium]
MTSSRSDPETRHGGGTKVTKITKAAKGRLVQEVGMDKLIIEPIPAEVEWIGRRVIGSSIAVHRVLGPGYKESIYVEALCFELDSRGLKFEREKPITVVYKGREIPGQRLDLIVEGVLVVECKVAEAIITIHTRQVTSYLRTTGLRLGFIFNFNVDVLMPAGFRRVAS